jgi:hypothetical protein
MPDILIEGGDAETAAQAMRVAINEIFETDPLMSTREGARPGTRIVLEMATLALTIPPGVFYGKKLLDDLHLAECWRRLITRAQKEQKATGAHITIDLGDGHHIPLEQAHPDKIREGLANLEEAVKRRQPDRL